MADKPKLSIVKDTPDPIPVESIPQDPELLPCPFCASKDVDVFESESDVHVQCGTCFATGPSFFEGCQSDENEVELGLGAILAWNRRTTEFNNGRPA